MSLEIKQIPAFEDNYIYILKCTETGITAVVDPGDANVVRNALGKNGVLHYILNTHHHHDHTGGNENLKAQYGCQVVGFEGDKDRIPAIDHTVKEWDTIRIGNAQAVIIATPGHTTGHIAYHFKKSDALFCGDTLFIGGCGRLFEGSAQDLFESFKKLRALPIKTKIYCAHEYTVTNLKFATNISPEHRYARALQWAKDTRSQGKSTVPSTLEDEMVHNIFLRAENARELAALRNLKDNY